MATKSQEPPILLLIDLQQGLVESPPSWGPRSTPDLAENVAYLLKTWRSKSWPVLHVHHDDINNPKNIIAATHPETFAPHACSKPIEGERVFVKHVGSPFVATDLPEVIKSYDGKRKIVVIGMDGSQCINNTTRHGTDLGYDMVVVADACASFGMEDWKDGKPVEADVVHESAMSMLGGYADVTSTKDVLEVLGYG